MKNRILFAAIGGAILFVWQFLAFAFPAFHASSMEFTPLQDDLLAALDASGLESGMYVLGQPSPELMNDESAMQAWQDAHQGSGHAQLNYQRNHSYDGMGMNLLRGFLVCAVVSFLLHALLAGLKDQSMKRRVLVSVGIGVIGFLFIPYTNYIWFQEPDIWAYLLDACVPWSLLGVLSARLK